MGTDESQRAAFEFFRTHAKDGTPFTFADVEATTKWSKGTWDTYKSKQFKPYIKASGVKGSFSVDPSFMRLTLDDFRGLTTQVRKPVVKWSRATYDRVVTYEFLLPLTKEDKLRTALDDLFYRDTLEQRAREIASTPALAEAVPREDGEADDAYVSRVATLIAGRIGGYSVSHVSGRFRADEIASREDAARMLVERKRYLVDETTAVVRFIIPCTSSRLVHGDVFDLNGPTEIEDDVHAAAEIEVGVIRRLFFLFFVEAVVGPIQGEDEIWLLEDSPYGRRLYTLSKAGT